MFDLNITYIVFIVMFLGFMLAFKAIVLQPLGSVLEARANEILKNNNEALNLRQEANNLIQEYDLKHNEAKVKCKLIISTHLEQALVESKFLISQAEKDSQTTVENTKILLLADKDKLLTALIPEVQNIVNKFVKAICPEVKEELKLSSLLISETLKKVFS